MARGVQQRHPIISRHVQHPPHMSPILAPRPIQNLHLFPFQTLRRRLLPWVVPKSKRCSHPQGIHFIPAILDIRRYRVVCAHVRNRTCVPSPALPPKRRRHHRPSRGFLRSFTEVHQPHHSQMPICPFLRYGSRAPLPNGLFTHATSGGLHRHSACCTFSAAGDNGLCIQIPKVHS